MDNQQQHLDMDHYQGILMAFQSAVAERLSMCQIKHSERKKNCGCIVKDIDLPA